MLPALPVLGEWLHTQALHAPLTLVIAATVLWFSFIYVLIAGGAYLLAIRRLPSSISNSGARTQRLRPG